MTKWLVAILLSTVPAWSANLSSPFDLESTAVLPKGVNSPRFRSLWMSVTEKYDNTGMAQPLGSKLNKSLSFNDLVKAQKSDTDKSLVSGSVQALGMGLNDSPGSTTGQVITDVNVVIPTYTRGITEDFTFILAVPVYDINVSADVGFVRSAQGQAWVNSLKGEPAKQAEVTAKLASPISRKLDELGYHQIESKRIQEVGDTKIGGKMRLMQNGGTGVATKVLVSVPTGSRPDASQVVDMATGDGAPSLATTVIVDQKLGSLVSVAGYTGYNYQPPDALERRIPTSAEDSLSADRETVARDRGDQVFAGTSLTFGKTARGFATGLGYNYQSMAQTSFSGSAYASERYRYLESQVPGQKMETGTVMAQYSTIEYFKEKTFFYPFTSQLSYSRVLRGENVPTSDLISAELVMFF